MAQTEMMKEKLISLSNENKLLKSELESKFDQTAFEGKRKLDDEIRMRKQLEA
jgi:cell shape-determining protein MreC